MDVDMEDAEDAGDEDARGDSMTIFTRKVLMRKKLRTQGRKLRTGEEEDATSEPRTNLLEERGATSITL